MNKTLKDLQNRLADLPVIGGIFKPKPKVAVVRMAGIIADGSGRKPTLNYQRFAKVFDAAFEMNNLKAVALVINSPGGSPAQSELLGKYVRQLADEKQTPVLAFIEDVAASGGYWLACAADEIYAAETSIIGSIGVISAGFGLREFTERHGIERRVHTSGKDKSFLDPFLEEKPADVKRLKALQKALHTRFIDWVKARRGEHLNGDDKTLFEGEFWLADKAIAYGLIDDIGTLKALSQEKYGKDIKLIDCAPEKGLISGLFGAESKLINSALDAIEHRAIWGRYGL